MNDYNDWLPCPRCKSIKTKKTYGSDYFAYSIVLFLISTYAFDEVNILLGVLFLIGSLLFLIAGIGAINMRKCKDCKFVWHPTKKTPEK